ncbi:hypothetical protein ACNKHU_07860 [Shigella flexneri]
MHIHISMAKNNRGENVLLRTREGEDSPLLKKMLAGMIHSMPVSMMALLAPKRELVSPLPAGCMYRRRRRGAITTAPSPLFHGGDCHNHRLEYRVAGAEPTDILVMAAIFACILHGLDKTSCRCRKKSKATGWERKW